MFLNSFSPKSSKWKFFQTFNDSWITWYHCTCIYQRTSFPISQRSQHDWSSDFSCEKHLSFADGLAKQTKQSSWFANRKCIYHTLIHGFTLRSGNDLNVCFYYYKPLSIAQSGRTLQGTLWNLCYYFFQCLQNTPVFFLVHMSYTSLCFKNILN